MHKPKVILWKINKHLFFLIFTFVCSLDF